MRERGGIEGRGVILGKRGEMMIDERVVAVGWCEGRVEIVGEDRGRKGLKILDGIVRWVYEVLVGLRGEGLGVGIMGEGKDGEKEVGFVGVGGDLMKELKGVRGKVNIDVVGGIVVEMREEVEVKVVVRERGFEGREVIGVRILGMVLVEEFWESDGFG